MLTMLDGPAEGQRIDCKRAPTFLRVVVNEANEFDALDLPTDKPSEDEAIFVYFTRERRSVRLLVRGKNRKRGGWRHMADYRLYENQPPAEFLRDNKQWQEWAHSEYEKNGWGNEPNTEGNDV